jgi:hypothetical protein
MIGFFLKYDYYSERSLLAKCRVRKTEYNYGREFERFVFLFGICFRLDPIPEPLVDESVKISTENEDDDKEQIDPSLPPELRKLMEQTKKREKEAKAIAAAAAAEAAAAEAQALKDAMVEQSDTQELSDEIQDGKDLTKMAFDRKKSIKDGKLGNYMIN